MAGLSEADTRAKLIDPAIHRCGWTEDLIRREETAGAIEIGESGPRRRSKGRVDYVLRVKAGKDAQPVAVALIEAKAEDLPADHGLEQAKLYAASKRLNVPFVYASNGHMFVEFDRQTMMTTDPLPISYFPTPDDLRTRYEEKLGFSLTSESARPLLTRYHGGEAIRRYYQDAAIRAVLEKVARGEKRALLSLATGAGKTFIAVNLLRRIADAGQLRRALFICDRDELRSQASRAFQNVFGNDASTVSSDNPQKNAKILIATYQTLDVDNEGATAKFLTANYPENYFSHIIIDECHRSAWGEWSLILKRNPDAIQIGLTATPRKIVVSEKSKEAEADNKITADNIKWFGEPVYEYDMAQGIEDGYLAACEVHRFDLFYKGKSEAEGDVGVSKEDLKGKKVTDSKTGQEVSQDELNGHYAPGRIEDILLMPDRVKSMCRHLFKQLLATGTPEQKTIIFCARDSHADRVASEMNNLYATWCHQNGQACANPYAFKCTATSGGNDFLPELRGSSKRYFVATTVDLLTTGVDVPNVKNIVFFKYVKSPISFYQMVGRGTRLCPQENKLMFRVYDYTNATRLFGQDFITTLPKKADARTPGEPKRILNVDGVEVYVSDAGRFIVTDVDGKAMPVTLEEYKERLCAKLVAESPTLEDFREKWINPTERGELIAAMPDSGRSPILVRELEDMQEYDLYDVLGELGYGMAAKTRHDRTQSFYYKHEMWLGEMTERTARVIKAIAKQFALAGTEGLENAHIFEIPEVKISGGLEALKDSGNPKNVLQETKRRMLEA